MLTDYLYNVDDADFADSDESEDEHSSNSSKTCSTLDRSQLSTSYNIILLG